MAGVPQAIDLIPEFVTGRQLYDYISHHFRKTISNPITVFPLFPLFSHPVSSWAFPRSV